jgi:hypothetical protein
MIRKQTTGETMHTMQAAIEQFMTSPVFGGRTGLFIVNEATFRELKDTGLPADPRLTERGYLSVVINGIPVIYMSDYTCGGFMPIEKELIGILAK